MAAPDDPRGGPSGSELAVLGLLLCVVVVVPLVAGIALDQHAGSSPAGLLGGVLVGIGLAAAVVWTRFRRYL